MNSFSKNKIIRVTKHILFWFFVWVFYVYFFSYNSGNSKYSMLFSLFLMPITIALSYFSIYRLIPKFLFKKKYFLFSFYGIYTFIVSTHLTMVTVFVSFVYLSKMKFDNMPPMSRNFVFILILIYLIVALISVVSLLRHNFKTISKNKELNNKILETQLTIKEQELTFLKKQIHPHFLFNSLNTIYGLALAESKQTPDVILKLSNLLDYILYQVNKPLVSLESEVNHLKEYVDLEKIRFQDSLIVKMNIENISNDIQLAPMLIIPLVENAFKHGGFVAGQISIEIELKQKNEELYFFIKNSYKKQNDTNKHGIGLSNLKKRLELNYKNNFELNFQFKEDCYCATLKIFKLYRND